MNSALLCTTGRAMSCGSFHGGVSKSNALQFFFGVGRDIERITNVLAVSQSRKLDDANALADTPQCNRSVFRLLTSRLIVVCKNNYIPVAQCRNAIGCPFRGGNRRRAIAERCDVVGRFLSLANENRRVGIYSSGRQGDTERAAQFP